MMNLPKVGFLRLSELQGYGLPAKRTLENRMRGGVIWLGSDVPPLRTVKVGGARVVPIMELAGWLQATGGMAAPDTAGEKPRLDCEEGAPVRRRGRPRKTLQQGGA